MKLLVGMTLVAMVLALSVRAQVANTETRHFEKVGLAFDFPAEWKLIDRSTDGVNWLVVSPEGALQEIAVITQYAPLDASCDFQAAHKKITDALVERAATQIRATTPLQTATAKSLIGVVEVEGVQLHGLMNQRRVTSEVYSVRRSLLFVSLVYLRVDNDSRSESAWEVIRKTLTISPTVLGAAAPVKSELPTTDVNSPAPVNSASAITGGVMNGKAVHLVQPPYPAIARQAHAMGTVVVQVVIDELGDVAFAKAISGHPLLQAASVAAAKASKFAPTKLCGEPVRVTGVIQYSFYSQ